MSNNGVAYLNQRHTLEKLHEFAVNAAPILRALQLQVAGITASLDAISVVIQRRVAPDLSPEQFFDEVIAVRTEAEACAAVADGLAGLITKTQIEDVA